MPFALFEVLGTLCILENNVFFVNNIIRFTVVVVFLGGKSILSFRYYSMVGSVCEIIAPYYIYIDNDVITFYFIDIPVYIIAISIEFVQFHKSKTRLLT